MVRNTNNSVGKTVPFYNNHEGEIFISRFFKETVTRDFYPWFFRQPTPCGSLIQPQNFFQIFRFPGIFKFLRAVTEVRTIPPPITKKSNFILKVSEAFRPLWGNSAGRKNHCGIWEPEIRLSFPGNSRPYCPLGSENLVEAGPASIRAQTILRSLRSFRTKLFYVIRGGRAPQHLILKGIIPLGIGSLGGVVTRGIRYCRVSNILQIQGGLRPCPIRSCMVSGPRNDFIIRISPPITKCENNWKGSWIGNTTYQGWLIKYTRGKKKSRVVVHFNL
jgi:hypothetical protein